MKIGNWFKGFEKGLERPSPEQRSVFLSECRKHRQCVQKNEEKGENRACAFRYSRRAVSAVLRGA